MDERDTEVVGDRHSTRGIAETQLSAERYQLGELLGRGGMGEVLEAHDAQIGRDVAIKRLRAAKPNDKQLARFMREARIQGRLEHPSIVPVHELGRDADGRPYFAMKKLAGTTLAQILRDGDATRYPRQRLLRALADVCLAVELAHTRGFVHRDLKPENVMLGDFGETYVLDWGVAKVIEDPAAGAEGVDGEGEAPVTAVGAMVGTPGYMAPEQVRGAADIDRRADVYSLGSMLFEILAGERLHPGGDAAFKTTVEGISGRPAQRRPEREIPPELDELCAEALALDRDDRIATARELGDGIQQFLDGDRDLELRKQLAGAHLEAATTAFAANDRSTAMREAGRALALEPTLGAAGELITRMMLEPPEVIPPEVKRSFDLESARVVRRTIKFAVLGSLGYLVFLPVLGLLSNASMLHLGIMAAASALGIALLLWMRRPGHAFVAAPVILIHVVLIMLVARMSTPFLLAPGIAAVTATGFMTGPQYAKRQATWVGSLAILAVLLPWFAEVIGWVAPTMTVFDGGVVLYTDLIHGHAGFSALMVLYTVTLVTIAVVLARGLRSAERGARQHMHLQAWQLRQLVASPGE